MKESPSSVLEVFPGPVLWQFWFLAALRLPSTVWAAWFYPHLWRGGRVVEGARLESVFGVTADVGSNPTPSA